MALKKDGEQIMGRHIKIEIIRSRSDLSQNRERRRSYRGRGKGRGQGRDGPSYGEETGTGIEIGKGIEEK